MPDSVKALAWSPDGYCLAVAWSTHGMALWSVFGSLLYSTLLDQTEVTRFFAPLNFVSCWPLQTLLYLPLLFNATLFWMWIAKLGLKVPTSGQQAKLSSNDYFFGSVGHYRGSTCGQFLHLSTIRIVVRGRSVWTPSRSGFCTAAMPCLKHSVKWPKMWRKCAPICILMTVVVIATEISSWFFIWPSRLLLPTQRRFVYSSSVFLSVHLRLY